MKTKKQPDIIYRDDQPVGVILDIDEYQEIIERLEDVEDLNMLKEIRKKPLEFRKLDDFLKDYDPSA